MRVPALYSLHIDDEHMWHAIYGMANPLLLWSTTALLVPIIGTGIALIFGKKTWLTHRSAWGYLVVGYLGAYVPWAIISRPAFFYHYLPAYSLLLLMLAGLGAFLWEKSMVWKWIVLTYCFLVIGFGLYFLPFVTGSPLTEAQYRDRLWLHSWEVPDGFNWT